MDRAAVTSWLLLPSPLVGAPSWEPVARLLASGGDTVTVADPGAVTGPDEVLAAFVGAARSASGRDLVLVPHSNAGYFAPLVAATVATVATVYVDAALPAPAGPTPLAPPAFQAFLAGLADSDGLLPPWTRWWDDSADLFPDTATRERVTASEPRLPLSYFHETVTAAEGWEARPQAYLAFGATYADEWARARALGWPTRRMAGGHLHLLHDPVGTTRAIRDLRNRTADPGAP